MKNRTKVDLSKYLTLTSEDHRALGTNDTRLEPTPWQVQAKDRRIAKSRTFAAAYGGQCARGHRTSMRELPEFKVQRLLGDVIATAHACLDCGTVLWRLHPGPRRQRLLEREKDAS